MYVTIRQALDELDRRNQNPALRHRVMELLSVGGGLPLPSHIQADDFIAKRPLCLLRQVATCRNEDHHFHQVAHEHGCTPIWVTYEEDQFRATNPEKLSLVRMRVRQGPNLPKLDLVKSIDGISHYQVGHIPLSLAPVHVDPTSAAVHRWLRDQVFEAPQESFDISGWYASQSKALGQSRQAAFYYPALMYFFSVFGIMYEDYEETNGHKSQQFYHRVVKPAVDQCVSTLGVVPLIVRQMPVEDSLCYPLRVMELYQQFRPVAG